MFILPVRDPQILTAGKAYALPDEEQDHILIQAEYRRTLTSAPLFGEELSEPAVRPPAQLTGTGRTCPHRRDRGAPEWLLYEPLTRDRRALWPCRASEAGPKSLTIVPSNRFKLIVRSISTSCPDLIAMRSSDFVRNRFSRGIT